MLTAFFARPFFLAILTLNDLEQKDCLHF